MPGETEIPVSLPFTVEGNASEALEHLAELAEHLSDRMNEVNASEALEHLAELAEHLSDRMNEVSEGFTEILGIAGAIGAGFSLGKIIEETNDHLHAVERITYSTGLAAEAADGLLESMEKEGVGAEEGAMILERLSVSALRNQETMGGLRRSMMLLGVDLRRGIVPSILELSKKMKEGQLSAAQLQLGMEGLRPAAAAQFIRFLQQGPAAIKAQMEELKRSGMAITQENLDALQAQRSALGEMTTTWKRMAIIVGKELMPIVTDLMDYVTDAVKQWTPEVQKFGRFLREHMDAVLTTAKAITKILLLNAVLSKVGAGGIYGAGKSIYNAAPGILGAVASSGIGQTLAGAGAAVADGSAIWAAIGGSVLVAGLASAAALIGIVVGGIDGIMENFKGVDDFIAEDFNKLRDAFASLIDPIAAAFSGPVMSGIENVLKLTLPLAIDTAVNAIRYVIEAFKLLSGFLVDVFTGHFGDIKNLYGAMKEREHQHAVDRLHAEEAAEIERKKSALERAKAGRADNSTNFYNNEFNIEQKFEEGFEPDRIITAFTNDLQALGERGVQSGFAPVGAVGTVGH